MKAENNLEKFIKTAHTADHRQTFLVPAIRFSLPTTFLFIFSIIIFIFQFILPFIVADATYLYEAAENMIKIHFGLQPKRMLIVSPDAC